MRTTFNLEAWLYQVCYTSIGHQRGHQPHLKWYPVLLLCTWEDKVHLLLMGVMDQLLVLTLPPYLLQKLQDKAGCLHVETASSSQPVNWGWIDLFSTIHVLDRVVSCNNQIDQTSWLMWIMGSSASLLFPAVSTTYLVISGFKVISSIQPKLLLGNKILFDDHSPKSVFLPGKLDCCRQGAGCGQNCSQLKQSSST